jgi:hypothetical protein
MGRRRVILPIDRLVIRLVSATWSRLVFLSTIVMSRTPLEIAANSVNNEELNSKALLDWQIANHSEVSGTLPVVDISNARSNSIETATHIPLPASTSTILLQNMGSSVTGDAPLANDQDHNRNISSLAPADGGFGAWSFVRHLSVSGTRTDI